MRIILTSIFVITSISTILIADTWAPPVARDYFSDNGKFIAHVTPATSESKALLEVFGLERGNRIAIWDCNLGNEGAPQRVLLSDDGVFVVTVNEWSKRIHGGMGGYVLAFYTKSGLIKHYSLEALLGFPGEMAEREFRRIVSRSVSGRSWTSLTLLVESDGKQIFCAWLTRGRRWLAWDVKTGVKMKVDQKLIDTFDEKARHWAINELMYPKKLGYGFAIAADVLGRLRKPEDRKHVESLLKNNSFRTWYRHDGKSFKNYYSYSIKRNTAEKVLATWDDRIIQSSGHSLLPYHYLGVIDGVVELSRAPKPEDNNWLCIFLVPDTAEKEQWYSGALNQRLCVHFSKWHLGRGDWPDSTIPFSFYGITPGRYHVKAIWDVASPYQFRQDRITGSPSRGDYENREVPLVCVKAGESVKQVVIDCTCEVGDQSVSLWASDCLPESPFTIEPCPCGKDHSIHRVCVVFDSPMPMKAFNHGPYHNYSGAILVQDGDVKTYTYIFTKECNDVCLPDSRKFDISIQVITDHDRLVRATVEGPYFAFIPLRNFLKALSIDTTRLDGRNVESFIEIYGDQMPRINMNYSLNQVIRILGKPSAVEGNQIIFSYKHANNRPFWIKFETTKDDVLLGYKTNLAGGIFVSYFSW